MYSSKNSYDKLNNRWKYQQKTVSIWQDIIAILCIYVEVAIGFIYGSTNHTKHTKGYNLNPINKITS